MNIYYAPEKYGLEPVAELEYSDHSYQFDTRVVWRDPKTLEVYTARDSGCSCPTPFEDYQKVEDLEEASISVLKDEIAEMRKGWEVNFTPEEADAFLKKVGSALEARDRRRKKQE